MKDKIKKGLAGGDLLRNLLLIGLVVRSLGVSIITFWFWLRSGVCLLVRHAVNFPPDGGFSVYKTAHRTSVSEHIYSP